MLEGSVTLLFTRQVKPGGEARYREWVEAFQQASREVKGFLGASTLVREEGNRLSCVVHFDSLASLRAWEESELRRQWVAKAPLDVVEGDVEIRRLEGLEFWFPPPPRASVSPSPHKMAIVIYAVVFGLVMAFTPVVRILVPDAALWERTLIMAAIQVGLMTYLIMPRVTKWLGPWLFPRSAMRAHRS